MIKDRKKIKCEIYYFNLKGILVNRPTLETSLVFFQIPVGHFAMG